MKKIFLLILGAALFTCAGKPALPAFKLTGEELTARTGGLPSSIKEKIASNQEEFLLLLAQVLDSPPEYTWLVDKTHSLPADYAPRDLVDLKDFPVKITKDSLLVRKVILDDFLDMINAAAKEGITITSASAYRSYKTQKWLFNYWVDQLGYEEASVTSAIPGCSQHQLGTTLDFYPIEQRFAFSAAGKWTALHAWEYGFSLSYPEGYDKLTGYTYEPWHFRYVGKTTARMIHTFFGGIQQHFLEFLQENRSFFEERRIKTD